ncbi:hypothetical protein J3Q64DRAFT_1825925 [Phycomyces blakesleeanus]|uniref:Extracellular membrane protein CFEM domain-containing protein n=2 Tax=Phycomyces blakesleeanus TaxID=4837 RepID=A0A167Q2E5_PHYB8|nr:hypothetical protein PHYBLDRAFT_62285 [Phycomyces blakesleeanus NRRL 1555(-)]OAD78946.1 hypothetical protein PHYBLDRAFT_62285 [Phycomyces blakesleeanus NRRL 1555(-)]|eukprot:XP_018296986.1 hypothetical protein PHYBLDRAFT_62285 [Phycomyces blakesleeanus NRRL 1555(-)]
MSLQSTRALFILSFVVALVFGIQCVKAAVGCAAEANFQGCKSIEETQLKSCGPSDYACQCAAQKLIQQCYNLCPTYASDASIQQGTVDGICAAVPVTTTTTVILPTSSVAPVVLPSVIRPSSSSFVSIKPAAPTASASHPATSSGSQSRATFKTLTLVAGIGLGLSVGLGWVGLN